MPQSVRGRRWLDDVEVLENDQGFTTLVQKLRRDGTVSLLGVSRVSMSRQDDQISLLLRRQLTEGLNGMW